MTDPFPAKAALSLVFRRARVWDPYSSYFVLYINDFENFLKSTIPNMYADDTCVNIASENMNELQTDLKNELENVSNWMMINKLSLNASKMNIWL